MSPTKAYLEPATTSDSSAATGPSSISPGRRSRSPLRGSTTRHPSPTSCRGRGAVSRSRPMLPDEGLPRARHSRMRRHHPPRVDSPRASRPSERQRGRAHRPGRDQPARFRGTDASALRADGLPGHADQGLPRRGVDIEVHDPTPIRGRRFLVQRKRYSGVVGAPYVRDLFGVVQGAGATKGILATTSHFSADARAFAQGKAPGTDRSRPTGGVAAGARYGGDRRTVSTHHPAGRRH